MIKTKEEIIKGYSNGWVGGMTSGDKKRIVHPAMDEYAKEIAVEFLKWRESLELIRSKLGGEYLINYAMAEYSYFAKDEDELFQKFLQSINKQNNNDKLG